MIKSFRLFLNRFKRCSAGVGYFDIPKAYVPRLQIDRSFRAKEFVKQSTNYGKTRYASKKPPVQRARGLIKQRTR